jgi:capsular polysaccharide biosynthesis protein
MSKLEKQDWLKHHLKIVPGADAFLIKFIVSTANPNDAAQIANTVAAAFCKNQGGTVNRTNEDRNKPKSEVLDRAVPPLRTQRSLNPIERGLTDNMEYVIWFLVGTGIAFVGFVVEKARRARKLVPAGNEEVAA